LYKILAKTLFLGKQVIYMPTCHSTNDIAMSMLEKPDIHEGCIVITDNQTAGRGQRGNSWVSESGLNLTYSIILKPSSILIKDQFFISMAISLSIFDVLDQMLPNDQVKIKWPNDIYVNESKIGGILIENTLKPPFLESAVVGIGLNINQRDFGLEKATSLALLTNKEIELDQFLEKLVFSLEARYRQLKLGENDLIKGAYLKNLFGYLVIRRFSSEYEFSGTIVGVSSEGKLQVEVDREVLEFDLKEIKFLRSPK